MIRRNIPHEQCLREKQASNIAVDEMITGSFHLASLEALAQGLPTFAYLDGRSLDILAELTGTHEHPWFNFRLEEAERPLCNAIQDGQLRCEFGAYARKWMETYYNDQVLVQHYVRAYQDLLERPEDFQKLRFDPLSRRMIWLAQRRDDLVWECRKTSFADSCALPRPEEIPPLVTKPADPGNLKPLKTAEWVAPETVSEWLCSNRSHRMDALHSGGVFARDRQSFHRRRYEFARDCVEGLDVADIACGLGYGCRILNAAGAGKVIGIDLCTQAIQYAREHHQPDGVCFIAGDATRIPLASSSIEVIISFETIEHVPNTTALLAEFHRILKPGGKLIVSSPNDWGLTDYHCHSWTPFELRAEIAAFFEIESTWEQKSDGSRLLSNKPPGIRPWSKPTEHQAECLIVVARKSTTALAAVTYDD